MLYRNDSETKKSRQMSVSINLNLHQRRRQLLAKDFIVPINARTRVAESGAKNFAPIVHASRETSSCQHSPGLVSEG